MTDKIVVFSTADSEEQARLLAYGLVERKLAACVSILPGATSVYRWKDKIEATAEWTLIIKSSLELFPALEAELRRLHTYEVPECIAVPIVAGSADYLAWLSR